MTIKENDSLLSLRSFFKSPMGRSAFLAIVIFLIMEIPVRLLLQPDPWLLSPDHWYFKQPPRTLIELLLVGMLIFLNWRFYPRLLIVDPKHIGLLIGTMIGSLMLFGALEFGQLKSSFQQPISIWMFWLVTGFCIGIGQELLYRGLLYSALSSYLKKNIASLLTTITFVAAPLHSVRLWNYGMQNEWTAVILLVAIFCAASVFFQWLREKTNSVVVPALAHGVGNAVTWVAVFS